MAETLVKDETCGACGANVRPQALFCYNCGSSVSADISLEQNDGKEKILIGSFSDDAAEEEKTVIVKTSERNNGKAVGGETTKLKSAASMRRKPKMFQRKKVKIFWEEPESAPNIWFILVAISLTLFALGLWLLALYLE